MCHSAHPPLEASRSPRYQTECGSPFGDCVVVLVLAGIPTNKTVSKSKETSRESVCTCRLTLANALTGTPRSRISIMESSSDFWLDTSFLLLSSLNSISTIRPIVAPTVPSGNRILHMTFICLIECLFHCLRSVCVTVDIWIKKNFKEVRY